MTVMKQISLRICILLCVFSLTIIPVLLINTFYVSTVIKGIEQQNKTFYCDLVNQLAVNVDYYYSQYAEDFGNISMFSSFQNILNRPQLSPIDEQIFLHYSPASIELRENVSAKISGDFFLVEYDRKNLANNTLYNLIDFSENMAVNIDMNKMDAELVASLVKPEQIGKSILCEAEILKSNTLGKYQNRTFFFFPFEKENQDKSKYLMGVMCNEDFFYNIYKDNSGIERGTVYLQDQFGKLLDVNHPSRNDYFKYDPVLGKYQNSEKVEDDIRSRNRMTLKDYQLLNIDSGILQAPQYLRQREKFDSESWNTPNCSVVLHKQKKFLSVFMRAPLSQIEISYFYPLTLVYKPVIGIVVGNLMLMALLLIIMSLVIIRVTNRLMLPIIQLMNVQKDVEHGISNVELDEKKFFGEFTDVGQNFNAIVAKITEDRAKANLLIEQQQQQILNNSKELEIAAKKIESERLLEEKQLLNILPKKIMEKIVANEKIEPVVYKNVSIFFFDLRELSVNPISKVTTVELLSKLNRIFNQFDEIMSRYGCYKIRTLGQSYLAVCGVPLEDSWSIQHMMVAAIECMDFMKKEDPDGKQMKYRGTVFSGTVTAGIIGVNKYVYDILGNIVTDMYSFAELTPFGKLSVSSEVYNTLQKNNSWKFERFKEVILKYGRIEEMFLFDGEKT